MLEFGKMIMFYGLIMASYGIIAEIYDYLKGDKKP